MRFERFAQAFLLLLFLVMLLLALSGCRTPKTVTVVEIHDSIHTQVVTNTVVVRDTDYITLPPQIIERTTPDSTSTIETDYAISTASILDGLLYHSLKTKTNPIPVEVEHKETTRDSIVYREKEVPVPYPVEKKVEKELTWWQKTRLNIANIALCLAGIWLVYFVFKNKNFWLTLFKNIF